MMDDGSFTDRTDSARLRLLQSGAGRIGTTPALFRTAEELAEVAVSGLADVAVVDVLDAVVHGGAPLPGPLARQVTVRRAAVATRRPTTPGMHSVGDVWVLRFGSPYAEALADLRPRLVRRLDPDAPWVIREPDRARLAFAEVAHSMIAVPLTVRGVALGMLSLYRMGPSEPFDDADVTEAAGLAAYAAAYLDIARRHTREQALASLVQRTLVPHGLPTHVAAETAWTYLPVAASGSWFDVVPLSGARIACIVGEAAGRGMPAVTLMSQVSSAIAALASVDLTAADILGRVHDLVVDASTRRPAPTAEDGADPEPPTAGCVVAVYDPVQGTCDVTRAGHPAPTVVFPDGTAEVVDVPAGPVLGGPGQPHFPAASVALPAGSVLALHTADMPADLAPALAKALSTTDADLQGACDTALAAAFPDGPADDALLLLVRTHVLGTDRTVSWTLENRPESAARARRLASRQLTDWGLPELAFTADLVVSELVTNSVRYSPGPIQLRLILREKILACEITDTNSAAPRLRLAADDDEGGRGLFLIAQFAQDWGVRWNPRGKTIWAEFPLPGP